MWRASAATGFGDGVGQEGDPRARSRDRARCQKRWRCQICSPRPRVAPPCSRRCTRPGEALAALASARAQYRSSLTTLALIGDSSGFVAGCTGDHEAARAFAEPARLYARAGDHRRTHGRRESNSADTVSATSGAPSARAAPGLTTARRVGNRLTEGCALIEPRLHAARSHARTEPQPRSSGGAPGSPSARSPPPRGGDALSVVASRLNRRRGSARRARRLTSTTVAALALALARPPMLARRRSHSRHAMPPRARSPLLTAMAHRSGEAGGDLPRGRRRDAGARQNRRSRCDPPRAARRHRCARRPSSEDPKRRPRSRFPPRAPGPPRRRGRLPATLSADRAVLVVFPLLAIALARRRARSRARRLRAHARARDLPTRAIGAPATQRAGSRSTAGAADCRRAPVLVDDAQRCDGCGPQSGDDLAFAGRALRTRAGAITRRPARVSLRPPTGPGASSVARRPPIRGPETGTVHGPRGEHRHAQGTARATDLDAQRVLHRSPRRPPDRPSSASGAPRRRRRPTHAAAGHRRRSRHCAGAPRASRCGRAPARSRRAAALLRGARRRCERLHRAGGGTHQPSCAAPGRQAARQLLHRDGLEAATQTVVGRIRRDDRRGRTSRSERRPLRSDRRSHGRRRDGRRQRAPTGRRGGEARVAARGEQQLAGACRVAQPPRWPASCFRLVAVVGLLTRGRRKAEEGAGRCLDGRRARTARPRQSLRAGADRRACGRRRSKICRSAGAAIPPTCWSARRTASSSRTPVRAAQGNRARRPRRAPSAALSPTPASAARTDGPRLRPLPASPTLLRKGRGSRVYRKPDAARCVLDRRARSLSCARQRNCHSHRRSGPGLPPRISRMKIVCDGCGAKYSIADRKGRWPSLPRSPEVRRCHRGEGRCRTGRGRRGQRRGGWNFDYGGEAVWHTVVGRATGPVLAHTQLGSMISAGVGWDAYVWREGFDGWKPAQDIEIKISRS